MSNSDPILSDRDDVAERIDDWQPLQDLVVTVVERLAQLRFAGNPAIGGTGRLT